MGMGINHWELEGMGLKKIFSLISTSPAQSNSQHGERREMSSKNIVNGCGRIIDNDVTAHRLPLAYLHRTCTPINQSINRLIGLFT